MDGKENRGIGKEWNIEREGEIHRKKERKRGRLIEIKRERVH